MDRHKREFDSERYEEMRDLFSLDGVSNLTEQVASIMGNYDTGHQLATMAAVLKAVSHLSAGASMEDELLNAPELHDRGIELIERLLSNEGWSLQEMLNILAYMIAVTAGNFYFWDKYGAQI